MTTPANPADLITWLRAQLDTDEQSIRTWGSACVHIDACDYTGDFMERFEEDRMLAEVDAKRRILDLHQRYQEGYRYLDPDTRVPNMKCSVCHDIPADVDYDNPPYAVEFPCPTLRLQALPYADRPGYREEWKP